MKLLKRFFALLCALAVACCAAVYALTARVYHRIAQRGRMKLLKLVMTLICVLALLGGCAATDDGDAVKRSASDFAERVGAGIEDFADGVRTVAEEIAKLAE